MDATVIYDDLLKCGVSELDAKVLLDCAVSGKSCSWVNNDEMKQDAEKLLNDYMRQFGLAVKIAYVSTRNKYIWEVNRMRK
jgi:hypothetical protein